MEMQLREVEDPYERARQRKVPSAFELFATAYKNAYVAPVVWFLCWKNSPFLQRCCAKDDALKIASLLKINLNKPFIVPPSEYVSGFVWNLQSERTGTLKFRTIQYVWRREVPKWDPLIGCNYLCTKCLNIAIPLPLKDNKYGCLSHGTDCIKNGPQAFIIEKLKNIIIYDIK